jgi:hypothetical protein
LEEFRLAVVALELAQADTEEDKKEEEKEDVTAPIPQDIIR